MGDAVSNADAGVWGALDALVTQVLQTRSAIAGLQAQEARLLASAADLVVARAEERKALGRRDFGTELALREVCAELAAAMRVSDRTVQARISDATRLVGSFPATLAAWEAGRIDAPHVSAIIDAGAAIDDPERRARYEEAVLEIAVEESANRLRPLARDIAGRIDPATLEERHERAQLRRRVHLLDLGEGMARLILDLPATLAHAILDRVTQMAYDVRDAADGEGAGEQGEACSETDPPSPGAVSVVTKPKASVVKGTGAGTDTDTDTDSTVGTGTGTGAGTVGTGPAGTSPPTGGSPVEPGTPPDSHQELRTMDELRADILADLLLTGAPTAHGTGGALGAITAHVQVTVPVLTLAGTDDEPALLAGHGPIDADTARHLAAGAPGWDRVLTHPHTGMPLAVDRYRPSAELKRFLRVRDEHCRFPGCRQPPWRCDVDHTIDAARGGSTSACNLAHFCKSHHILKHASDWKVRQLGGGVLEWSSPTGRVYRDRPAATVRFTLDRGSPTTLSSDPPPF